MTDFKAEKERFLKLPLNEKRKLYSSENYVEPANISNWNDMFESSKDELKRIYEKDKTYFDKYILQSHDVNTTFNKKIALWQGDITTLEFDAIVNAANKTLLGGGGVDGAIHKSAGPMLKEECRHLNGCQTGDAKITGGYKLPAKYVIHTVGPVGEKPDLLKSCYERSLQLMLENGLKTIAFPCISTGVYGYPQIPAASLALNTVRKFLETHATDVDLIVFTLFLNGDVMIYKNLAQIYFPAE